MCGIVGGVRRSGQFREGLIKAALGKMRHRGPDDTDFYKLDCKSSNVFLGHARLSILDLSAAGRQPMHSSNGRFCIVFNGEIYNYRELRAELSSLGYDFASNSDTDVLLAAWAHWGTECLLRLTGMFAFAVLDKLNGTLTCVRDAFGIKPLFYSVQAGSFSFASEIGTLLELAPTLRKLNWQRSFDYLVHGDYDSTSETFYEGVHNLASGHWLQIDLATAQCSAPQRWWQPRVKERLGWHFDDAVEQVREQFLQNIRLHLRSDVPLGAALSGGVDSSAVVCAMRHVDPVHTINTFSYIADGSDVNEEGWVDRVNQQVGAVPHKIYIKPADLARDLDSMIRAQGEPFGSTSIYAQYRVFQAARESGIVVTLDGQGADEMLAGYSGYAGQRLRSLLETRELREAWRFWGNWSKWPGRSRALAAMQLVSEVTDGNLHDIFRKIYGRSAAPSWIRFEPLLERGVTFGFPRQRPPTQTKGRRVVDELALSLSQRGLSSLLRHGDRNSMAFSIESRVPFLTGDFANLFLSMPEHFLISRTGETKHVFREAMRGIVPDDVLNRKDKIGFSTNEENLILGVAETAREWLKDDLNLRFLDQRRVLAIFDDVVSRRRPYTSQIWRWINFSRWYKISGFES
jgi:asparagine synthase (glutamine-hydrolysing)